MKLIVTCALFLLLGSAVADDGAPAPTAQDYERIRLGLNAADKQVCDHAIELLSAAVDVDSFRQFPEATRRDVLDRLVDCAVWLRQADIAIIYLQQLTQLPGEPAVETLLQLFVLAVHEKDYALIVDSLERLTDLEQTALRKVPTNTLAIAHGEISRDDLDGDLYFRFLQALYDGQYRPLNPFPSGDEYMVAYARVAADRGDVKAPVSVIEGLTLPYSIAEIRMDRRFDRFREDSRLESYLDVRHAAEEQVRRFASLAEQYPGALEGQIVYSWALEAVRRYEDALTVIESAARKLREPDGRDYFFDVVTHESSALERYADALRKVGRHEEADAVLRESASAAEAGGDNVTQRIRFAFSEFFKGRFAVALEAVADIRPDITTEYGLVRVHVLRACAGSMGHRERDYMDSLSYLLESERAFGELVLWAYLCLDDSERAAENLIQRLQDPRKRSKALKQLQLYVDQKEYIDELRKQAEPESGSAGLNPGEILTLRFDQLRHRDDVLRAVNAVGRIEVIPIDSGLPAGFLIH